MQIKKNIISDAIVLIMQLCYKIFDNFFYNVKNTLQIIISN